MTTVPFLLAYILSLILIYNLGSEDKENNDCLGFFSLRYYYKIFGECVNDSN